MNRQKISLLIVVLLISLFSVMVYALDADTTISNSNLTIAGKPVNKLNISGSVELNVSARFFTVGSGTSFGNFTNVTVIFWNATSNLQVFLVNINDSDRAVNLTFNKTINTIGNLGDGIYNITINGTNITEQANISNYSVFKVAALDFLRVDNTVPFVSTPTSPASRQNFTTGDLITVNVTISNETGTATFNVSFNFTNNTGPAFNVSAIFANSTLFNRTFALTDFQLQDGNHTLRIVVNDSAGNTNNSVSVSFVVDTTAPSLVQVYNLSANQRLNISKNIPTFSFQVNDSLSPTMECLLNISTVTNTSRLNVSNGSTFNVIASASLPDGHYDWAVTCNDSVRLRTSSIITNFTVDTVVPFVSTPTSPASRQNFTTGDLITVNVTISNETGTATFNVSFNFTNNTGPAFNVSAIFANSTLFNRTFALTDFQLQDGNHTLRIVVNDSAGNTNNSVSVSFVVDTTAPSLVQLYNLSANQRLNISKNIPTFSFQVNDSLSPTMECLLNISTVTNVSRLNASNGSTLNFVAGTSLPDGHYDWAVTCNDSVRLRTSSIITNFTVDTVVPDVQAISVQGTAGKKNFTTGGVIPINGTIGNSSGTAILSVIFELSNGSLRNLTAVSFNATEYNFSLAVSSINDGNHTLYVFANDTAGNENRTFNKAQNITFVVDTTAPSALELYNLTNRFNTSKTIPTFTFQVNDSLSPTMECLFNISSVTNVSRLNVSNGSTFNQAAGAALVDGVYSWAVTCNDSVRLTTSSIINNFTVDTVVPGVQALSVLGTAGKQNFTTGGVIPLNTTIGNVSGTGIHIVIFELSNGSLRNLTAVSFNATEYNYSLSVADVNEGNHTLYVFANDTAGNTNKTFNTAQNVTFVVDRTAPTLIQLYNMTNKFNTSKTIPTFSWQVNDSLSPTMECTLNVSSTANLSRLNASNGTTLTQTVSSAGLADGRYNYSVFCNDSVRLVNYSVMNNFTVSTTGATVRFVNVSYTSADNTPPIVFNYSHLSNAEMNSSSCTLYNQSDSAMLNTTNSVANGTNLVMTVNVTLSDGRHQLYVNCTDPVSIMNQSTAINVTVDTTAPVMSSTSSTASSISVVTSEVATCHYDVVDFDYTIMSKTMSGAGSTTHEVSSLSAAATFYVRCADVFGKAQTVSTVIKTVDSNAGGGGGGGGGGGSSSAATSESSSEAAAETAESTSGSAGSESAGSGEEGAADQGAAAQAGLGEGGAGAEGSSALAGQATGQFVQVLKNLGWLWVTLIVVAVGAAAGLYLIKMRKP